MNRYFLTDDQWDQIHDFLQAYPNVYVGSADACRRFINAVLWILRSGRKKGSVLTFIHAQNKKGLVLTIIQIEKKGSVLTFIQAQNKKGISSNNNTNLLNFPNGKLPINGVKGFGL